MPHYVVERTFPDHVSIPLTDELAKSLLDVDDTTGGGVVWLSSYVDSRRARTLTAGSHRTCGRPNGSNCARIG
jgi:hypothetical protein